MSVKIIDKDEITEEQMENSILDFTYGVLSFIEGLDAEDKIESGAVSLNGCKAGVLVSKWGKILTLQRVDPEEKEARFPLYKFDLEEDELVYFDTEKNRYYEPCFEVYAEIQVWDYYFSGSIP
jgi:hypothetical protein